MTRLETENLINKAVHYRMDEMSQLEPRVWMEPHESKKGYILMFEHVCTNETVVSYSLPGSIWAVMLFEPLTVMPSISCGHCRIHGWFKDGNWVSVNR